MKRDTNDVAREEGPVALAANLDNINIPIEQEAEPTGPRTKISELLAYDPEADADTLIGNGWLRRSGSTLIVGQSGIGKSALIIQMILNWAAGKDFFGMDPKQPLKSLVIQAENDDADLSQMVRGVVEGCGLNADELEDRVTFIRETVATSAAFARFAYKLIEKHTPDLVWIDPLLTYIGGDISDQATCSKFLRNELNPISLETGCCWMVVHHTGKPARDPQARNGWTGSDYSYLGIGSSELTNWPRAILCLREVEDGLFELRAAKRGKRAGLTVSDGGPEDTVCYLQQSDGRICWLRAGRVPGQEVLDEQSDEIASVQTKLRAEPLRYAALVDLIVGLFEVKERQAKNVIRQLVSMGYIIKTAGFYSAGRPVGV